MMSRLPDTMPQKERDRASTWYFSFHLESDGGNVGLLLDPHDSRLASAGTISFALRTPENGTTNVTGFIAGFPEQVLRRCTVESWLAHKAIRNLQLTAIAGDRRKHCLITQFLSLPAADASTLSLAPVYNHRVDLRDPSNAPPARPGRPRSQQPPPAVSRRRHPPSAPKEAPAGQAGSPERSPGQGSYAKGSVQKPQHTRTPLLPVQATIAGLQHGGPPSARPPPSAPAAPAEQAGSQSKWTSRSSRGRQPTAPAGQLV
jgi:hypothetical protein